MDRVDNFFMIIAEVFNVPGYIVRNLQTQPRKAF